MNPAGSQKRADQELPSDGPKSSIHQEGRKQSARAPHHLQWIQVFCAE